jgi:hypothetical protein
MPERLQPLSGRSGLGDAFLGEVGILPAGEEILEVPLALAMPNEYQETFHS